MNYLVKDEQENLSVIRAIGFTPKNTITTVPDSIQPEDYEFLKVKTVKGKDDFEQDQVVVSVDERKKTEFLEQIEQQRLEREQAVTQRRNKKETLIANLKKSNAQGPLKELIDLVLMDYE